MAWRSTAVTVALVALLAACTAPDATAPDVTAPDAPTPEPPVVDVPPEAPEPAPSTPAPAEPPAAPSTPAPEERSPAEELAALGVVLSAGFSPHAHLRSDRGRIVWPPPDATPEAIGDPPVPDGLGPLTIDARIERFPLSCIEWTRTIVGVDAGDGEAARRMAEQLVARAVEDHAGFRRWFATEADCEGIGESLAGNTYQELAEEPCALPAPSEGDGADVREVRCFVSADFGYPAGAAHTYLGHHQFVFDRATGERLTLDALFAAGGRDPDAAFAAVVDIVETVTDWPDPEVRQARPTAEGLLFGFSPYEAGPFSEYTRDVFIPWELLPRGDGTPST